MMRKTMASTAVLVSALTGVALATTAYAGTLQTTPKAHFNGFSLGYKYTHYKRHEPGVTTKGGLNGAELGYEHMGSPIYFDFNLSYDTGKINYNGVAQIPNSNGTYSYTPLHRHTHIKALVTYNIDVGPAFSMFSGRNILAPFIGTGGQYIYGSSPRTRVTYNGSTYTLPQFARKNLMAQAQFGLADRYAVTPKLQIQGKAAGLIDIGGIYSDNAGGSGTYSGGDLGYRFKLRADYRLTHHIGVFASGAYYYFQTPRINSLGTNAYEPAANKHEYSAVAGLTFRGL